MSAIEPDKKQWSDPKDYGLPFVEIAPRVRKVEPDMAISEESDPAVLSPLPKVLETSPAAETEDESVIFVENPVDFSQNQRSVPTFEKPAEERKSNSWVWAVLLIGLGIVGVIVWQIQTNRNTTQVEEAFEIVEERVEQPVSTPAQAIADSTAADQNQDVVNQDTIQSAPVSIPNISKAAESGTTIANTAAGNLIRVQSKAAQAQYFIIVGSLPNERMALEEANKYFVNSAEIYLIEPFDGGKNYRLALSKFDSFKTAAAKLEEIKSQYTEELWILKY